MSTALSRWSRTAGCVIALPVVCVLGLSGCGAGDASAPPGAVSAPGAGPVAPATVSAASGTVATRMLPVYWVGDVDGEQRLFREFRDASEEPEAVDPIVAAAELMAAGTPRDPDQQNLWHPADEIGSSMAPDGTITVDMPSKAFRPGLDEGEARLALQQLVHTVTSAAATSGLLPRTAEARVVVLVDGRAGEEVFGSVRLDGPLRAEERLEAPLWIDAPLHGARSDGRLVLSGRLLEGVRGARWTVTARNGSSTETVSTGTVDVVSREDGHAAFRADLLLPPGEHVVTVEARDARGRTVQDDKQVDVRRR